MKKILSVIMVLTMLAGLCVPAAASDEAMALAPHAIISSDVNHYNLYERFNLSISVMLSDVTETEYMKISMDCNKDAVKYVGESTVSQQGHPCVFTIAETQTGYLMTFSFDRSSASDVYILCGEYAFEIIGESAPQISFSGVTKMINKEPVESVLSIDMPDNKVYDIGDLPEIGPNGDYAILFFDDYVIYNRTLDRVQALNLVRSTDPEYPVELTKHYYTNAVATGDYYYIYAQDGRICDEVYICISGDVDCDGKVTASDARLTLRHSARIETLDGLIVRAADADRNGKVNASDARLILRVSAQLDSFPPYEVGLDYGCSVEIGPLLENASAGCQWECTASSDSVKITKTIEDPNAGTDIVGGAVYVTYSIGGTQSGTYTIHFEYKQPWENEIIDEFDLVVTIF